MGAIWKNHREDCPPPLGRYGRASWDAAAGRWVLGLTAEGKELLARWAAEWPHPRKLLATAHPGAYRFARKAGFDREDIDGLCREGAAKALLRFDPERASLTTYAAFWMRAVVQRAAENRVHPLLRCGKKVFQGNAPVGLDGDSDLLSFAPARRDPAFDPANRERVARLRAAVAAVLRRRVPSLRYREIFALRNGLHDGVPLTLDEVGEVFGISRERVRQIEAKVLKKVRDELEEVYHDLCR